MPAENVTLKANATKIANDNTKYKVEHYKEDLNADTFTKVYTDNKTGTTGELATYVSKTYEGFTFDESKTEPSNLTILGDGSLVVKLYYTRNSYTLTLVAGENVYSVSGDGVYEYGEEVSISATLENDSKYDYDFTKWESSDIKLISNKTSQNTTINMPAGDVKLTAIASKEEKLPNVIIKTFEVTNYPDSNGKTAEPGNTINYNLVIENNENYAVTVKPSFITDGDIKSDFVVTYKDANGNIIKTETLTSLESLEIPANGTVEVVFAAKVDDTHVVNDDFDTKVTLNTTSDNKITDKTASTDIQKSANIVSANNKNKNIILILDLSGSMKDNGKIGSLRKSAKKFTDKLKADAVQKGNDITLTIIGIGAGQSYDYSGMFDTTMGTSSYAYKIGSYTKTSWVPSKTLSNLSANGGTNITGALTLTKNIIKNENNYRAKYNVNYLEENAETFTVLLTDGANGPSGNIRITGTESQVQYVRNNSTVFAIGFGNGATVGTAGYSDLLAITNDASSIYSANSETDLNKAFEAIANKIGQEQSVEGIIEIALPEDGKYFPITITHTVDDEVKTLATINYISELSANNITISESGDKLYWDLSGTYYSDKVDLKLSLNLESNATNGTEAITTFNLNNLVNEISDENKTDIEELKTSVENKAEVEENEELETSGESVVEDQIKKETSGENIIEELIMKEASGDNIIEDSIKKETSDDNIIKKSIVEETSDENIVEKPNAEEKQEETLNDVNQEVSSILEDEIAILPEIVELKEETDEVV